MTRYFRAKFSDGAERIKASVSRDYTHAWRSAGSYKSNIGVVVPHHNYGFSQSAEQAEKNMTAENAWLNRTYDMVWQIFEVVATEEITESQYKAARPYQEGSAA